MRTTIYKCDECKKEIGNKTHLSLSFGPYSGVSIPPSKSKQWLVVNSLQGKFTHFCSTEHLKKFFDTIVKGSTEKSK